MLKLDNCKNQTVGLGNILCSVVFPNPHHSDAWVFAPDNHTHKVEHVTEETRAFTTKICLVVSHSSGGI